MRSFHRVSTKFPHQKISWSFDILRTVSIFHEEYLKITSNFSQKKHYLRISVGFDIDITSGFEKGGWSGPAVVRFVVFSIMSPNLTMNFLFEKERKKKGLKILKFLAKVIVHIFITVWKVSKCAVFFSSIFSGIHSKFRKMRTRKNSAFGHFSHSASFLEGSLFIPIFVEQL